MGDFIKELNIIDFLGLLLPGCALLLILGGEAKTQSFLQEYLTFLNGLSGTILFLVSGYVLGSLIHEGCDWLEKFLWKLPLFDPKLYAAYQVGSRQITEKLPPEDPPQKNASFSLGKTLLGILLLILPLSWAGGCMFPQNWLFRQSLGTLVFFISILFLFAFFVVLALIFFPYEELAEINRVRRANPYIQTMITSKKNFSKRIVFDGFHVMMRNLLFVFLSTFGWHNGYPLVCYSKLLNLDSPLTGGFIAVIVFLMALRSFHYAYLKYKYSYEDFLVLCSELDENEIPLTVEAAK